MAVINWRNRRRYIGAGALSVVVVNVTPVPANIHEPELLPNWKISQRHITPDAGPPTKIHRYQPLPSWKIQEIHVRQKRGKPGGFGPSRPFEIPLSAFEDDEEIIMLLSAFIEVMNRER